MALINLGSLATCFAFAKDVLTFDNQFGLGILAFSTQHKLVDENVKEVLEFFLVVSAVDDVSLRRSVPDDFSLGAEFKTKELGEVNGWTTEIVGDVQHVGDDRFDTVAFAFDLDKRISCHFKTKVIQKLRAFKNQGVRGKGWGHTFD
jgi:hypothetical protein